MDEDYSLLVEECFYLILDSHSLLPVCHITVSEDDDPIYFLPDGSGYINSGAMIDFDGDIVHQTPMLNRYTHLTATVKGYPMYVYFGAPHDQITVLYEGKEPLTVPVPEYLIQDERFDYLGNNG